MQLPTSVIDGWAAYWQIEPWPEHRAELLNAVQCASVHHDLTGESVSIDTFLPKFDQLPKTPEQEWEEAARAAEAWASQGV